MESKPISLLLVEDDEQALAAAFDLNVANYLSKPVNFDQLIVRHTRTVVESSCKRRDAIP